MNDKDAGRMVGKSEIIWGAHKQMLEISPAWACEDLWSTLYATLEESIDKNNKGELSELNARVRTLIDRLPR